MIDLSRLEFEKRECESPPELVELKARLVMESRLMVCRDEMVIFGPEKVLEKAKEGLVRKIWEQAYGELVPLVRQLAFAACSESDDPEIKVKYESLAAKVEGLLAVPKV